ncbi:MAG: hypothetical protein ACK5JQ_12580, partial [Bacteroidota bacterium]
KKRVQANEQSHRIICQTPLRETSMAAHNMGLAKVAVQWLIEHLCFVFAAFAKPRNVSGKACRLLNLEIFVIYFYLVISRKF